MTVDLSQKTIQDLFFHQIKKLSQKSVSASFDYQYSEWWKNTKR